MKNSGTWRKVQIQLEVNEPKFQPSGSKKKGRLIKFMRNKTLKTHVSVSSYIDYLVKVMLIFYGK